MVYIVSLSYTSQKSVTPPTPSRLADALVGKGNRVRAPNPASQTIWLILMTCKAYTVDLFCSQYKRNRIEGVMEVCKFSIARFRNRDYFCCFEIAGEVAYGEGSVVDILETIDYISWAV